MTRCRLGAEEDRCFPLDVELAALHAAGFDEVECFWRRGLRAVIGRDAYQLIAVGQAL